LGADAKARSAAGDTPLHEAAGHGAWWARENKGDRRHRQVIELLVESGAEIAATNSEGKTPLDLARDFENDDIAELLVSLGAE
jgi:ankyrin repeat protein